MSSIQVNGKTIPLAQNNGAVLELDGDLANADWTKRSFDFPGIENAQQMREHLELNGSSVREFKLLPVYRLNLDSVPWLREL